MKTAILFTNTFRVMVQIFVIQFAKFFRSFPRNGINNLSKSKAIPGTASDEVPSDSFRKDTLFFIGKPTSHTHYPTDIISPVKRQAGAVASVCETSGSSLCHT